MHVSERIASEYSQPIRLNKVDFVPSLSPQGIAKYTILHEIVCRSDADSSNVATAIQQMYGLGAGLGTVACAAMLTDLCTHAGAMPKDPLEGQVR